VVTAKLVLLLLSVFSAVLQFVALNFDGVSPGFGLPWRNTELISNFYS
jgi:hypothetical protein